MHTFESAKGACSPECMKCGQPRSSVVGLMTADTGHVFSACDDHMLEFVGLLAGWPEELGEGNEVALHIYYDRHEEKTSSGVRLSDAKLAELMSEAERWIKEADPDTRTLTPHGAPKAGQA